jgi:hypothetical protein
MLCYTGKFILYMAEPLTNDNRLTLLCAQHFPIICQKKNVCVYSVQHNNHDARLLSLSR